MSLQDLKFADASFVGQDVASLPNQPSAQGITAEELKARFDNIGKMMVALGSFNTLIDELVSPGAAGQIGAAVDGRQETNVGGVLGAYQTELQERYTKAETDALVGEATERLVSDVAVDLDTGIITVTYKDGAVQTFDTALEKVPASFELIEEGANTYLVITNVDGSVTRTDVTELVNDYRFANSDTVSFSVVALEDGSRTVTASVRSAAVTLDMLSLDAVTALQGYEQSAASSARAAASSESVAVSAETGAEASALLAQSWAAGGTGTRSGEDENNARYWSELARGMVDLPIASADTAGVVRVGDNLDIDADGVLSATVEQGPAGADGKSAYETAQEGGYAGTEAEFAAALGSAATFDDHVADVSNPHRVTAAQAGAAPAYSYGTEDMTAGTSELATGTLYLVYE